MKILLRNGKPLMQDGKILSYSGGGGSATVTTKAGWKGTPVPTSGYLENVYFNTKLTPEEIMNLIDKLIIEFGVDENYIAVPIFGYMQDISYGCFMSCNKEAQSYGIGIEGEIDDIDWLFVYSKNDELNSNYLEYLGFIGWNPDLIDNNGVLNLNKELTDFAEYFGDVIVVFLNSISSLISSIPFERTEDETITLTGDYDGTPVTIELGSGIKPSTVPNVGYVENIYFNTDLSSEEVVSIIKSVDLDFDYDVGFENDQWYVLFISEATGILMLGHDVNNDGYAIYSFSSTGNKIYFNHNVKGLEEEFQGWNPDFNGVLKVNGEAVTQSDQGSPIIFGLENAKLTSLMSATPYSKPKFIDLKSFIKEQKLPLKINVKGPKVVSGSNASGTPIPSSGHIENIYVNVNTEPEEFANKLDELLAGVGVDPNEGFTFPLFTNEDESVYGSLGLSESVYGLVIFIGETLIIPYVYTRDSTKEAEIMAEVGFIGWNPTLTDGVIPVNAAIIDISILLEDYFAMWEMAVNEITPFISSTPFVSSDSEKTIELAGEYDGTSIVMNKMPKAQRIGTSVPNSGYLEKVYINTTLSPAEVAKIIPAINEGIIILTASQTDSGMLKLPFIMCASNGVGAIIYGLDATGITQFIFVNSSDAVDFGFVGWNPEFNGEFIVNHEIYSKFTDTGEEFGLYNNALSSLFSSTPFELVGEDNVIDLETYINKQKIPLKFKLDFKPETVIPDGYIKPEGTVDITSNGEIDVTNYAIANVNIPKPTGTKYITSNGVYGITNYDVVDVKVPIPDGYIKPEGTVDITSNGTHIIRLYETANVNVPIPEGYIVPSGELEITENGNYDISQYKNILINVPLGLTDDDIQNIWEADY